MTTSLSVTLTATSAFDPTQTVTTNVTVSPSGSVSIAFGQNPPPPITMNTGGTASIVANVSGDNTNAGVNWTLSCTNSSNTCGTFNPGSPAHTNSGSAILYTSPTTVPANGLIVTVTATAAAGPNPFITAMITVTAPVPTIGPINGAPSSLPVKGKSNPLYATVTNDSTIGGGVDWLVTCTPDPTSDCGTFSSGLPTDHTISGSGGTTTYTAPTVIPLGTPPGIVTITAKSSANPASTSTAAVTITASTAVTIKFTTGFAPPAILITNATASIEATVTNDQNSPLGVDWALACTGTGTNPCGTLSVTHTASGGPVVYTAPSRVPTGARNGGVTITATATAVPNPSVSGSVQILPPNVTITVAANSPLDAGSSEQVTAAVTGDSTNAGVSWSATCTPTNGAGCGTFNPTTTTGANPLNTSYTAPASVPTGNVTITATSLAAGVSAVGTAPVTIQPNANLGFLSGPYALSLTGQNSAGIFAAVGSITADGKGGISNGEEFIDAALPICSPSLAISPFTGTYSIGSDGRGTMTLQTGNTNCFGNSGVQTLSFVVVGVPGQILNPVRALVTEFDNNQASRSLDSQTLSGVTVNGTYAFTMSGNNIFNGTGGSITADIGGVFVASGGVITSGFLDENDQATAKVSTKQNMGGTGSYSAPDAAGCGTILFGPSSPPNSQFTYEYCIVNAGQIKLLSWDPNSDLVVARSAYTQGAGTFSAQNAFTLSGRDLNLDTPFVAGGLIVVSGSSFAGGSVIDVNDGGVLTLNSSSSGSTFSALSNDRGTITLAGSTGGLSSFAFYPTASNGVLLFGLDANFASVGIALPQTVGDLSTSFNGNYAMNFMGPVSGTPQEDVNGLVTPDPANSTLAGTVDVNGAPQGSDLASLLLTGTFVANANGRYTGTISLPLASSVTQKFTDVFYIVDTNTVLFIEDDTTASATAGQTFGILQLQNLVP